MISINLKSVSLFSANSKKNLPIYLKSSGMKKFGSISQDYIAFWVDLVYNSINNFYCFWIKMNWLRSIEIVILIAALIWGWRKLGRVHDFHVFCLQFMLSSKVSFQMGLSIWMLSCWGNVWTLYYVLRETSSNRSHFLIGVVNVGNHHCWNWIFQCDSFFSFCNCE